MKHHTSRSDDSIGGSEASQQKNRTWDRNLQERKKKKWTTKPRESSEGRIWGGDQSSRLAANDLHLSVCCSYEKSDEKTLVCLLLDTSKEILNSRWSMFGSGCFQEDEWKSSVACVDCPSHSHRGLGLTEIDMLHSADPFPAQKPQNCIVVGGGNHVQELQGGDIEKEVRGGESKRDEHVFLLTRYLWVGVWEIFFGGFWVSRLQTSFLESCLWWKLTPMVFLLLQIIQRTLLWNVFGRNYSFGKTVHREALVPKTTFHSFPLYWRWQQ